MARVTQAEVEEIIEVDTAAVSDLTPFIDTANALVTDVCSGSSYSEAKLTRIELWLSAHFYAIRDPRNTAEQAGSVQRSLQSKVDLGFSVTHYGQMAMLLDTAGNLSKLNGQMKKGRGSYTVGATWMGTDLYTEEDE